MMRRLWRAWCVVGVIAATTVGHPSERTMASEVPPPVTICNLRLSVTQLRTCGSMVAFTVRESEQGRVDLNGDGDAGDAVMHLFESATMTLTNLKMAVFDLLSYSFLIDVDGVVFSVMESAQGGADLNNDGDSEDHVLHVYNSVYHTMTNLQLAAYPQSFRVDGPIVAFAVDEGAQGHGDLNGDGDDDDKVLHVHDIKQGTTRNLRLWADDTNLGNLRLDGLSLAWLVRELDQGLDLNGDGDTHDFVVHFHDVASGVTKNIGYAVEQSGLQLCGTKVAFAVREALEDLNGDRDTSDSVIHVYDHGTGNVINLGLALEEGIGPRMDVSDTVLAFGVYENAQGHVDLTGDGDSVDLVAHVYDVATGRTENLAIGIDEFISDGVHVDGDTVAFQIVEKDPGGNLGGSDLNDDGDLDDTTVFVYNSQNDVLKNLGLAVRGDFQAVHVEGTSVVFRVFEDDQGDSDLNGDGDSLDSVMHWFDRETGITTNLGLEASGYSYQSVQFNEPFAAFEVGESAQANTDFDGDGAVDGFVVHVFDAMSGTTTNLGLSAPFFSLFSEFPAYVVGKGVTAVAVPEKVVDLNLDGDTADRVIHVAYGLPGDCGNLGRVGNGCPGSGGFTPALALTGCPAPGFGVTLSVTNGLGGAPALVFFGMEADETGIGDECMLLFSSPLAAILGPVTLSGMGPGDGSFVLGHTVHRAHAPGSFVAQGFIIDSGTVTGFSNTNAVQVIIP